MTDYRPRLSIEITEHQNQKLRELVPWGTKNQLFSTIIDQLIPLLERHGSTVIALILDNKLKADRLLNIEELKDGNSKRP